MVFKNDCIFFYFVTSYAMKAWFGYFLLAVFFLNWEFKILMYVNCCILLFESDFRHFNDFRKNLYLLVFGIIIYYWICFFFVFSIWIRWYIICIFSMWNEGDTIFRSFLVSWVRNQFNQFFLFILFYLKVNWCLSFSPTEKGLYVTTGNQVTQWGNGGQHQNQLAERNPCLPVRPSLMTAEVVRKASFPQELVFTLSEGLTVCPDLPTTRGTTKVHYVSSTRAAHPLPSIGAAPTHNRLRS